VTSGIFPTLAVKPVSLIDGLFIYFCFSFVLSGFLVPNVLSGIIMYPKIMSKHNRGIIISLKLKDILSVYVFSLDTENLKKFNIIYFLFLLFFMLAFTNSLNSGCAFAARDFSSG
jgi:hypothetical protein